MYKRLKLGGGQTYVQLIDVSKCYDNLRHNWLQKPALTDVLCVSYISFFHCSKVIKPIWEP